MHTLQIILQVVVALGILNVWVLRYNTSTAYRGGDAKNMREEFAAYGLPFPAMCAIGGLKVGLALVLLVGIWIPSVVLPAAAVMALLMVGALTMHLKVKDPLMKSLPAAMMLVMSLAIVLIQRAS